MVVEYALVGGAGLCGKRSLIRLTTSTFSSPTPIHSTAVPTNTPAAVVKERISSPPRTRSRASTRERPRPIRSASGVAVRLTTANTIMGMVVSIPMVAWFSARSDWISAVSAPTPVNGARMLQASRMTTAIMPQAALFSPPDR